MSTQARIFRKNVPKTLLASGVQYGEPLHVPTATAVRALAYPPPDAIIVGTVASGLLGTFVWDDTNVDADDGATRLKLAASTTGRYAIVTAGTIAVTGNAVASVAALRALATAGLADGYPVSVKVGPDGGPVAVAYFSSDGLGFADDGRTIFLPDDKVVGSAGRWYPSTPSAVVPTIAALRLAVAGVLPTILVQSYSALGDGGGGIFDYDSSDVSSADNGGTIIVAGTKRYKRRYSGPIHAEWFGATTTPGADNGPRFTAALAALGANTIGELRTNAGTFEVITPIQIVGTFLTGLHWLGTCGMNGGLRGTLLKYTGTDGANYVVDVNGGLDLNFQDIDIDCNLKAYNAWSVEGNQSGGVGASGLRWYRCLVANVKNPTASVVTGDAGTDVFTATGHDYANDRHVKFTTSGTLPAGLDAKVTYVTKNVVPGVSFKLNDIDGNSVDITTPGSGTHHVVRVDNASWLMGNTNGYQCDGMTWQHCSGTGDTSSAAAHDQVSGWYFRGGTNTKDALWIECGAGQTAYGVNWERPSGKIVWVAGGMATDKVAFIMGSEANFRVTGLNLESCTGMILKGLGSGGRAGSISFNSCQMNITGVLAASNPDIGFDDIVMYYNGGFLSLYNCGIANIRTGATVPWLMLNSSYSYGVGGNLGIDSTGCSYLNGAGPYIPVVNESNASVLTLASLQATPAPIWSHGDIVGPAVGLVKALPLSGRPDNLPSLTDGYMKVTSGVVSSVTPIPGTATDGNFGAATVTTTGTVNGTTSLTTNGFVGLGPGTRSGVGYVRSDNGFQMSSRGAGAYDLNFVTQSGDSYTMGDATHVVNWTIRGTTLVTIGIGGTDVGQFVSVGLALNAPQFVFGAAVASPKIFQANLSSGTGQKLLVQAQTATVGTGGGIDIAPGDGTVAGGVGRLVTGNTIPRVTWGDTTTDINGGTTLTLGAGGATVASISSTEVTLQKSFLSFAGNVVSPIISQQAASNANGQPMEVLAQSGDGSDKNGGPLYLFAGDKTGAGTPGAVFLGVNAGATTVLGATTGGVDLYKSFVTFQSTVSSPLFSHIAQVADVNGWPMNFFAQNAGTGSTNRTGGGFIFQAGKPTGTGEPGRHTFQTQTAGGTVYTQLEVVQINGRKTVLNYNGVTATQLPAGTGDNVTFIGDSAIQPSSPPVGGGILYSESGVLKWMDSAGVSHSLY